MRSPLILDKLYEPMELQEKFMVISTIKIFLRFLLFMTFYLNSNLSNFT